jgi:hypothetical protein
MTLHRDVYWVGKQWAVTGHGIQACNQKQRGKFDIAAARLWEDGVQDAVRGLKWVNKEDFDKAIATARKYYPEPPRKAPRAAPKPPPPPPQPAAAAPINVTPAPEPQPSKPANPTFDMRFEGAVAKLRPVWRVRIRLTDAPAGNRPRRNAR